MMAVMLQATLCLCLFLVLWLPLSHQQSDDVDRVVPYSTQEWPPASLTFVFDITGSMNDDLDQVKRGANAIFKAILSQSDLPVQEFILVPFHDPVVDINDVTVTRSTYQFKEALDSLYVDGGGDCPEMAIAGITLALQVSRPGSFIFVFTDASAKDYHLTDGAISLIQSTRSNVVFVLTGDCGLRSGPEYDAFKRIATASTGEIFQLTKTAVDQVITYIDLSVQARVVNLLYTTGLQPGQHTIYFDVDSCLQDLLVTVTATGTAREIDQPENEIRVQLTNPLGHSDYSFEINEKAVKVVKVESPEAGRWYLNITSRLTYAITVSGRSVCDFKVSFTYEQSPGSYYTRPVAGLPVSAVLNPTVPPADAKNRTCNCQNATVTHLYLMKLNGTQMEVLPLNWEILNPFNAVNLSTFTAPDHEFLVMITGRDEHGYKFQRTTSTIVPGQAESPVAIHSQTQTIWALRGEPLELLCRYRSIVSVTIVWYKDGQPLDASENLVFYDDGRLVILNVADSDAGRYHCEIQSSEGDATGFPLNVSIAESPTIISGPGYLSKAPGQNALFVCQVAGAPSPEVKWWINGSVPRYNPRAEIDIIPGDGVMAFYRIAAVRSADQGNVTCYAKNIAGETQQTGKFEVQVGPTLTVTRKRLVVYEGNNVSISCKGNGVPAPSIDWFRGDTLLNNTEEVSVSEKLLSFSSVRLEDRGVYICIASNTLGQRREMAHLEVHATPQIWTKLVDTSVFVTETVILECLARGNPPSTIFWLHDGRPIRLDNRRRLESNSQKLVITRVRLEDSGFYTCVAENTIGQDNQTAYLRVTTPPVIIPMVTPIAVSVGKCILLPCDTQGVPPPVIAWYKSNSRVSTRLPKYEVYANGTLQICNVVESDADTYTCVAINQGGRTNASTILDVQISPKISLPLSDQWVLVDTTASFRCLATKGNPKPEIMWLKGRSQVLLNSRTIYISKDITTLEIRRVKSGDEGAYTCIAKNDIGSDSSTAYLNVIVPPVVRSQMIYITVREGQTALLNCFASGNPRPTIEWFKGSQAVVPDGRKYVSNQEGTLQIINSQIDDAGQYQCLAANRGGESAKNLTVDVLYSPVIVSPLASQVVLINNSAMFQCIAIGNPEPQILWLKGGERLMSSDQVDISNDGYRVTIPRAQPNHAGVYTCNASNSVGHISDEATLLVLVPAVISITVNEIAFIKGSSAFLSCDAHGIPAPVVHWEHNGQHLIIDGHKYTFFPNGTLQIKNVQVDDSGIYHCVASNRGGNDTAEITVDIHFSPSVVVGFTQQSILVGECLTLQCVGWGNPPPVTVWRKNNTELRNSSNVYISPSGTQLAICPVKESDADMYTCIVANNLGQSNVSAKLDVIVPSIIIPTFDMIATVIGGDAWLPCEATGNPPPEISWYRDSEQIDNHSTKYHIHRNGSLQIRNLEQGDSGIYQCVAINVGGQHTHNITLDLHFGPTFITIPVDINLLVNNNVVLNCSAFANPSATVRWYKDDTQIQTFSNSRFFISSDGTQLTISDLREEDAGVYTCMAKNYVNNITVSSSLTVIVPSMIFSTVDEVDALLSLSAWLPCDTYGIPSPHIYWVRDGLPIGNSSKYMTFPNGTLRIENLEQSDNGVYECVAVNDGGIDTDNVTLNVQYGPLLLSFLEDEVVLAHSDVVFYCPASGNPLPFVTWSRDGQLLTSSVQRVEINLHGRVLVLKDVRPSDSGNYTCTAENTVTNLGTTIARKASSTARLTVIEPPTIRTTDHQVLTFHFNETAWLVCTATGVPPPNIQWLKDGVEIESNSYQILSNGTLRIESVSTDNTGLYQCIATNNAGITNISMTLDVLYPPFITNIFYDQSVVVDESVTLQCIADGNPSPQVEWWFQGHPLNNSVQGISISNDGTHLTIDGVKPRDAGQYTCVATNLIHEHRRTLNLDIIEPPEILTTESNISVKIYSDAYLDCVVYGNPSPQVIWLNSGMQINLTQPRFSILDNGTLHISGVLVEDGGVYQCLASNIGGSASKNTTLHVLYPPRIIIGPGDQTEFIGLNVTFYCIVDASLPLRITWTKNGRSIYSGWEDSLEVEPIDDVEMRNIISISPDGSVLTISGIDETASGWYTCFAQNREGLTTSSGKLDVIVGTSCLFDNRTVEHVVGTTASFQCGAVGSPKPVAVWEKNGVLMSGQSRFSSNSGGLLTITDVREDDDGMYICRAQNSGGNVSCTTRMVVLVPPEMTKTQSDQRILQGSDAIFRCEAEGNPTPVMSWEKDGGKILVVGSVEISDDKNTLIVKNVTVDNAGWYTCIASNKVGHVESTAHLFIIVPPTVRVDEMVSYTEGDIAFMHCRARGVPNPSVEWMVDGEAVQSVDLRYEVLNEGTLKIINVTRSDAGIYECIATNEGGQMHANTTLQVKYKPVITEPPDDTTVLEGGTVSFTCIAQSMPPSNITWLKGGNLLKNVSGATEISTDGNVLSIIYASPTDRGLYTCLATNEVGSDQRDAWLQVIVVPVILTGQPTVRFTQNGPAWLPCDAVGQPPPTIQWLKDGVDVSGEERYHILPNGTLYIAELHLNDSGVFQCVASNDGGLVTVDVTVDVLVPPRIVDFDGNVTVDIGHSAELKCMGLGNPRPQIAWMFEGRPVNLADARFTLMNNGTLRIDGVMEDDLGYYTCIVQNSAGDTNLSLLLDIKYGARIVNFSYNTDVEVNSTARLICVAEGNPDAIITWTVNGQPLPISPRYKQQDDGTLEITGLREDEGGLYECRATNRLGSGNITVYLTVLVPPIIIQLQPDGHEHVVTEGYTLYLDCVTLGYPQPQISWRTNGRPVDLTKSRFTLFPNGTLRVDRVIEADDGLYTCIATNLVGTARQQSSVDVWTRPFVETTTPRTVHVGGTVHLSCVVSGNPQPSLEWYYEGTPVADLGNKRIKEVRGDRLRIRKIRVDDAGKYYCVATNAVGNASGLIEVIVRTHPSIGEMKDLSTYRGMPVYLHCPVRGSPPPTVTWIKDGQVIVLNYRHVFFPLNGTLKIASAEIADTGNYTCRAENVVGAAEKKMVLHIRVPIVITSGPVDTIATAGQTVVLRCEATGVPAPLVQWMVKHSIKSSSRLQEMGDGSLRLRNVTPSDSGMLTCVAANDLELARKSAILTVVVPPTIGPVEDVTVMQGEVAVLSCPAKGTQPIRYTWVKHSNNHVLSRGRHHINQTTGSLTVRNAHTSDAGSYECRAQNQVATARQSVRLFVQTLPHITIPGNDLLFPTPNRGQSVVLYCQVDGSPQPEVIWTKDGVNVEGRQRFVIGNDNSLTILNLRAEDTGVYACMATNAVGDTTLNYTVIVQFSPIIVTGPQSQTVTSGERVTLTCLVAAQPPASIVWRKNGVVLTSLGVTSYPNGTLVIHSVKKADAGYYRCSASNALGQATSQAAYLTVRYPATITVPPRNQSVEHRSSVALQCSASGLPSPRIHWTCHGRLVPLNSANYWIQRNRLQIPSTEEKDEGWCCCVAVNQVGNDTECAYITVTSRPHITLHNSRLVANVGGDALINVVVSGDGKLTTYWTHNGVRLDGSSRHQKLSNNSLLIRNVKVSDAGRYRLTASNEFGSALIEVELTVYEPPHVRSMQNRSVIVGSTAVMQCIADGKPSPVIAWYRDSNRISTGGRFIVSLPGMLQISRTVVSDAGKYTCTATNVAGVHSRSVHLSVLEPPTIVGSSTTIPSFRPSDTLKIPCVVRGNPKPVVTWTKNGIAISSLRNPRVYVDQNNTLVIRQVQSSDSGSYTCSARSSVGTTRRTVTFSLSSVTPSRLTFPTIIRPSTSIGVLTVTCVVQGLTNFNVVWSRNGRPLPSDSRYDIRTTVTGSVLTISNAGPQDNGAYGCTATGTRIVTGGTEIVVGQPVISSTQTNIYNETPGNSIQLSCPATGDPAPNITWFKDSAPLAIDRSKYIASGLGTLTIRNLQASDSGYYSCEASNVHGTATHTVVVLVNAATTTTNRRVYDVYIGSTVQLSCTLSFNGIPSTNVMWLHDSTPLLSGNRIAINPTGTLTISSVEQSDMGIYTCYSETMGRTLSLESELRLKSQERTWQTVFQGAGWRTVQQGERWQVVQQGGGWQVAPLDNQDSVAVTAGRNVLLQCPLEPIRTWYKDGNPIPLGRRISLQSDGSLRINQLKLTDSGSYECRSSSSTSQKHTILLDVKANPSAQPTEQPTVATVVTTPVINTMVVTTPVINNVNIDSTVKSHVEASQAASKLQVSPIVSINSQVPPITKATSVESQVSPTVPVESQEVIVTVGEPLRLDCVITGSPDAYIAWMKDGRPVDVGSGSRFTQFRNGTLTVNSVQLTDDGNYTCIASNIAGDHWRVRVIVNPTERCPCEQICDDSKGHYECLCVEGYTLGDDKVSCQDVNECNSSPCDHICENQIGSYRCTCFSGYLITGQNKCEDLDECTLSQPCDYECENVEGSFNCTCPSGYRKGEDGTTCININECEETGTDCAGHCLDTYGSYQCMREGCPEHYQLIREGLCWKNCSPSEVPCPAAVILKPLALKHHHPQNTPILNVTAMDRQGRVSNAKNLYHRFAQDSDNQIFAVQEDKDGNFTLTVKGDLEPGSRELQILVFTFTDDGKLDTVTVYICVLFVSEYSF